MRRPGRSNISARLTSFAPGIRECGNQLILPKERLVRSWNCKLAAFFWSCDLFIIFLDILGIFYPVRGTKIQTFIGELSFKNEETKDSRSIDSDIFHILPSRLYSLLFSLKISTKFFDEKTMIKRKNRSNSGDSSTPVDCARRGSENGILFFIAQKKPFHRKNPFFGSAHVQSWARATFLNRSGRKEKMDRWRNAFLINAFRTHAREGDESSTTILHRFLASTTSLSPVKSPLFSSLRLFNSSAHVAAPLKGALLSGNACLSAFRKGAELRNQSHDLRASLLRVHTRCSSSSCAHKCPTENVNLPSERFACAIRYRLQTSFVLRDTVYFFPFRALERILGHSFETFIFSRDVLLFDRVVSIRFEIYFVSRIFLSDYLYF